MKFLTLLTNLAKRAIKGLNFLNPLLDLAVRLYLANIFWKSGLIKVSSWPTTLMLFSNVYSVPVLPPEVAAVLAAGTELGGAVLLAFGLAGRFGASALFFLNFVAVISYSSLSDMGLKDHFYWGVLLLFFILHGPGRLSLDHFIRRRFMDSGVAPASLQRGRARPHHEVRTTRSGQEAV